jgi:hypothetical protein
MIGPTFRSALDPCAARAEARSRSAGHQLNGCIESLKGANAKRRSADQIRLPQPNSARALRQTYPTWGPFWNLCAAVHVRASRGAVALDRPSLQRWGQRQIISLFGVCKAIERLFPVRIQESVEILKMRTSRCGFERRYRLGGSRRLRFIQLYAVLNHMRNAACDIRPVERRRQRRSQRCSVVRPDVGRRASSQSSQILGNKCQKQVRLMAVPKKSEITGKPRAKQVQLCGGRESGSHLDGVVTSRAQYGH